MGRGFQSMEDLMSEFGMTDEEVAEMDRQWDAARRAEREGRCIECGFLDGEHADDCLGV